jgi:antitoxin CcdA
MPRISSPPSRPRRATNVTLPETLLQEARDLGITISAACEHGLTAALTAARRQRWIDHNQGAIEAWNDHIAEQGLPLAPYRQF